LLNAGKTCACCHKTSSATARNAQNCLTQLEANQLSQYQCQHPKHLREAWDKRHSRPKFDKEDSSLQIKSWVCASFCSKGWRVIWNVVDVRSFLWKTTNHHKVIYFINTSDVYAYAYINIASTICMGTYICIFILFIYLFYIYIYVSYNII